MAGVNGDRKGKKDDNGIGSAMILYWVLTLKLVLGGRGAASWAVATLAVKRVELENAVPLGLVHVYQLWVLYSQNVSAAGVVVMGGQNYLTCSPEMYLSGSLYDDLQVGNCRSGFSSWFLWTEKELVVLHPPVKDTIMNVPVSGLVPRGKTWSNFPGEGSYWDRCMVGGLPFPQKVFWRSLTKTCGVPLIGQQAVVSWIMSSTVGPLRNATLEVAVWKQGPAAVCGLPAVACHGGTGFIDCKPHRLAAERHEKPVAAELSGGGNGKASVLRDKEAGGCRGVCPKSLKRL
ncbi:hypothetical protein NFI96_024889 [Prochilodus magdalenae]|nr:hypothetical protein NFI96_024889 [Prochilodus magdalenae]